MNLLLNITQYYTMTKQEGFKEPYIICHSQDVGTGNDPDGDKPAWEAWVIVLNSSISINNVVDYELLSCVIYPLL